jgi:hypothetical protein
MVISIRDIGTLYLMLPYVDSACSSCLGSIGSSSSSFLTASSLPVVGPYSAVKHRSRRDIRKYGFTNRIVDLWNSLPNHIVEAKTMFQFENRLDRHWENHPMKYDFTAEYGPTTF